jgi:hypothetical protein
VDVGQIGLGVSGGVRCCGFAQGLFWDGGACQSVDVVVGLGSSVLKHGVWEQRNGFVSGVTAVLGFLFYGCVMCGYTRISITITMRDDTANAKSPNVQPCVARHPVWRDK